MGYVGNHGVATLRCYKYSGVDHSVVAKYILQPFWSRFVNLFLLWFPAAASPCFLLPRRSARSPVAASPCFFSPDALPVPPTAASPQLQAVNRSEVYGGVPFGGTNAVSGGYGGGEMGFLDAMEPKVAPLAEGGLGACKVEPGLAAMKLVNHKALIDSFTNPATDCTPAGFA